MIGIFTLGKMMAGKRTPPSRTDISEVFAVSVDHAQEGLLASYHRGAEQPARDQRVVQVQFVQAPGTSGSCDDNCC